MTFHLVREMGSYYEFYDRMVDHLSETECINRSWREVRREVLERPIGVSGRSFLTNDCDRVGLRRF